MMGKAMKTQTQYVAGFLFSEDRAKVALIRKKRPKWQAGRLNGIGGHVEPGESPPQAMVREFAEETGLQITTWELFATRTGPGFTVRCYVAFSRFLDTVKTTTDEDVEIWYVNDLQLAGMLPDLRVLILLALDQTGIAKPVHLIDDARAAA